MFVFDVSTRRGFKRQPICTYVGQGDRIEKKFSSVVHLPPGIGSRVLRSTVSRTNHSITESFNVHRAWDDLGLSFATRLSSKYVLTVAVLNGHCLLFSSGTKQWRLCDSVVYCGLTVYFLQTSLEWKAATHTMTSLTSQCCHWKVETHTMTLFTRSAQ